jgi:hypothetical protein
MDNFIIRHVNILRSSVSDYKRGAASLNSLIQILEGMRAIINFNFWNDALFSIVIELEQVNAISIIENRKLKESERVLVESALTKLEVLIDRLEAEGVSQED